MSDHCETCRFALFAMRSEGECHRYAPAPQQEVDRRRVMWPVLSKGDWCGEFEEKGR